MAIKTREEIINALTSQLGSDSSDTAIGLLEDVTDTLADYENRANGDGVDWKEKYETNDKAWRDKYIARFNSGVDIDDFDAPQHKEKPKVLTFENLFKEG